MKKIFINIKKYKFKIFLWLILAGVVVWLLYMAVVPSGKISYVYDFNKSNKFIEKLGPAERVELIKDGSQKISGDPVYFSLWTPRRFNKAAVEIIYKNEKELPIIELGVLADKTIWRYDLQPVENRVIDKLALVWDVINENGTMLLQREKKYNSHEEFLNNLPARNEIALYNFRLVDDFILEDYNASSDKSRLVATVPKLRGAYQFYTYIKDEPLDFNFTFLDLNKNKDSDPVEVNLYYDNGLIDRRYIEDKEPPLNLPLTKGEAGGNSPLAKVENERGLSLKVPNLPEGVYKVEVKVNNDIVTKKLETTQSRLSFINSIWLNNNGETDINIYTDSRELQAKTINPESLQTIKAGNKEWIISETYKQFSLELDIATTTEILLENDGIMLAGDGVFSFSQESIINPNYKKVRPNFDINKEGVNYVLANYEINVPDKKGWKTARVQFDLTNAYRENGKYSLLISIPGLKADDEVDDYIEVGEIKVKLEGISLWEKIREVFN